MKLNKKGSSLLELIISIALISVVLTFMIRLLVDLNDAETNNDYAKNNQINRAEIIKEIESDLNNKIITKLNDEGSNENNLVINFSFKDNTTAQINATTDTLTYKSSTGNQRKWTMKDCKIYIKKASVEKVDDPNNLYSMLLNIEIHTANERNTEANQEKNTFNNRLDDISISYIGSTTDFDNNMTCLGNDCQN